MQIPCPECETLNDFEPVTVVRPESSEQDALLRGDLNCVDCAECHAGFLYETPILYRDDQRKMFVYFLPESHCPDLQEALKELDRLYEDVLSEIHANERPDCRLVTTRQRLIEKIALIQAGYNDRLVEYVKKMLIEHNPGLKPDQHEMFYDFTQEKDETMTFQVFDMSQQEHAYTLEFQMDDYFGLEDYYLNDVEARDTMDGLFPTHHVQVCELF